MGTKLKNGQSRYQSKAKVVMISKSQLTTLRKSFQFVEDIKYGENKEKSLNFPIIIQGNGYQSEIFNLYLLKKIQQTARYNFNTFASIANQLVDFLRFLEDEKLDCLKLHKNKQLNAIFKYRIRLIAQINAGIMFANCARTRMNTVVNFYRSLITDDLVKHKKYGMPFNDIYKYIVIEKDKEVRKRTSIKSHDLVIHIPLPRSLNLRN